MTELLCLIPGNKALRALAVVACACLCSCTPGTPKPVYSNSDQSAVKPQIAVVESAEGARDSRAVIPGPQLELNSAVEKEIDHLLRGQARSIKQALVRRQSHLALLEDIFRDEGLPVALINLAIIESRFNPVARSRAGAVGLWQLMRGTARSYGLKVSSREDQRKDVVLSSVAAARLLRDLHGQFGDWHLALAAYNAGPATVSRGIKRSGADTFWELSRTRVLKIETRRFVPRFIAAAILAEVWDKQGPENLIENVKMKMVVLLNEKKARDLALKLGSSHGA